MKKIKTARLILRSPKISDINDFFAYAKDPQVGPMAGWEPHQNIEQSYYILESFIAHKDVWAIESKEDGKMIGSIGLHFKDERYEIGYVLSKDYWSKGLMTEAVEALLGYAFNKLNLSQLWVAHYPDNYRSKRVIEKNHFVYQETLTIPHSNPFCDTKLLYKLSIEDYRRFHHA
jgi:putative acetyltransferase